MATLEFAATTARAGIIATSRRQHGGPPSGFFGRNQLHDLRRSAGMAQPLGHDPHRPVYMPEERLVSGAKVVQTRLTIGGLDEPVLRTFAVTRKAHFTLA